MKLAKLVLTIVLATMFASSQGFAADGIRHVVSFKFKKDADPAAVKKIETDFAALKEKIPLIQNLEWGTNNSPENHNKGFTHVWIVSFKDAKDRDAYLIHPAHKAFVEELKDVLDDAFVIDFTPHE